MFSIQCQSASLEPGRIKTHFGYASILTVYAPTNPTSANEETMKCVSQSLVIIVQINVMRMVNDCLTSVPAMTLLSLTPVSPHKTIHKCT